jgi:hypothetical protein
MNPPGSTQGESFHDRLVGYYQLLEGAVVYELR